MVEDIFRVLDFILRLLTLLVASVGGWKIYQELQVLNRRKPLLHPVLRSSLDGATVELLNVTGKPVIVTEHAFRFLSMEGREGRTPYFTALEREQSLPLKLEDGQSFTVAEGVQVGDQLEVNLDCFVGGKAFQWATTITGAFSARNTYAEITPPSLTELPS